MVNSKKKEKLNEELLDNVAGGADCTIPEYVYYENNPDRFNAILQGSCPSCGQYSVSQIGSACYGCSSCGAGYVLIANF